MISSLILLSIPHLLWLFIRFLQQDGGSNSVGKLGSVTLRPDGEYTVHAVSGDDSEDKVEGDPVSQVAARRRTVTPRRRYDLRCVNTKDNLDSTRPEGKYSPIRCGNTTGRRLATLQFTAPSRRSS
ncbi:hypothetical protein A4X13_0g8648 [Tilletia indica]|uniref:Uncharacterized protein n=1 Tax=Tilletia indica TaxID=43049 RepID=A0A177T227_9BASI|nr:hypothetical protein A4X13_0g8648 [Tilletia indica]